MGKNLSLYLKSLGHSVTEFDIARDEKEDLRVPGNRQLSVLLSRTDFVIFLAFDVGGARYLQKVDDTYEFINNNLKIVTNVFEQLYIYQKPFIFASSQLVNNLSLNYGLIKLMGEKLTKSLGGVPIRIWNVYGKEDVSEKSHLVTDLVFQAKSVGRIRLLTNGKEQRQFVHISDCCEAFFKIVENYSELSKVPYIDLTSFEWMSVLDVAKIVQELTNCELSISTEEGLNYGHQDPNKLILDYWIPKTTIVDGIKNCIMEL